jgi:predicted GIY-YIG superfamily endonuclease
MHMRRKRRAKAAKRPALLHHVVYVVELKLADGTFALYVGMTGLTPAQRYDNHKKGIRAARVVRKYGVRLAPEFYEHIPAMTWANAVKKEKSWAEELRANGYVVFGGH